MTPGNVDALASDELEFNDTSRWVDENVPQIRVPSVSIGALGDQPYVRCAHRHRGLLGTAARVDGAFAVAWTLPEWIAAYTACEHDHHVEHHRNAVAA